jgi:hypothetical protein
MVDAADTGAIKKPAVSSGGHPFVKITKSKSGHGRSQEDRLVVMMMTMMRRGHKTVVYQKR